MLFYWKHLIVFFADKIIDTGTGQSKITSFVFVKIPKTGSTTLFSILSRFSKAHSLNLLMPVYRNASGW